MRPTEAQHRAALALHAGRTERFVRGELTPDEWRPIRLSYGVRDVTACPFAGTAPSEPFDVSPYCIAIHEYFLFNPLNLTLPRKFKIAIEGCEHDCAQAPVNDIGLYAKARDGARGFSLHA